MGAWYVRLSHSADGRAQRLQGRGRIAQGDCQRLRIVGVILRTLPRQERPNLAFLGQRWSSGQRIARDCDFRVLRRALCLSLFR